MALSVLQLGNEYCLYDSTTKKAFLKGSQDEMFMVKHTMEQLEQIKENKEHLEKLKLEYIDMLVSGGHTEKQAIEFLKSRMPSLWN